MNPDENTNDEGVEIQPGRPIPPEEMGMPADMEIPAKDGESVPSEEESS